MDGMFHDLSDVVRYLETLPPQQKDAAARLVYIQSVLEKLGNPQDALPAIHIAGTSGKGSTAYAAAELLHLSGKRVGLVVSPHVVSIMERAQIYSDPLSEADFITNVTTFITILHARNLTLSYIEFFVVFAYWLFADMKLDVMVIEVGMGGRLDATNVLSRPDKVVAITDIGYDHVEILGDSLSQIATEKSGIITPGSQVVMNSQDSLVEDVIQGAAASQRAHLHVITGQYDDFRARNCALAAAAVSLRLGITIDQPLLTQLANQSIPGRLEAVSYRGHRLLLDVAHNPQKMSALTRAIQNQYKGTTIVPVVAFGSGKLQYIPEMMRMLQSLGSEIRITTFPYVAGLNHQSVPLDELRHAAQHTDFRNVVAYADPRAYLYALDSTDASPSTVYLITGSFYLVDAIRSVVITSSVSS